MSINHYIQCKQMFKQYIIHNNEYNKYLMSIFEASQCNQMHKNQYIIYMYIYD